MAYIYSARRSTRDHSNICNTPDASYDTTSSWPSTPELDTSSSPSPLRPRAAAYSPFTPSRPASYARGPSDPKLEVPRTPSSPQEPSELMFSTGRFPFLTPCDDPATPENRFSSGSLASRGLHDAPRKPSARSVERHPRRTRSAKSEALNLKPVPQLLHPGSSSPINIKRRQARAPASPYATSSSSSHSGRYSVEDMEDIRVGRDKMMSLLTAASSQ